jgi:hypothetical protein
MARQIVVEITRSFRVSPSRYTGGDRLPGDEYSRMVTILLAAGIRWNDSANVEETLAALRVTYEPLLDGVASALLLLTCYYLKTTVYRHDVDPQLPL